MEPSNKLIERADTAAHASATLAKGSVLGGGGSAAAVWLTENAVVIGSIAGLVSIAGMLIGLILNAYFNHRKLELQKEQMRLAAQHSTE